MKRNRRIWKTAAGDKIPVYKLEDSHLANILNMLHRNGEKARFREYAACSAHPFDPDSMAAYYADNEASNIMENEDWMDYAGVNEKLLLQLLDEAHKRDLKIKGITIAA